MRYKLRSKKSIPLARLSPEDSTSDSDDVIRALAQFRYALRRFLRFSENAARQCGVTPQQHQLILGVAGFTGRSSATVSELAEFLQERPHSVAGLVERAVQNGLVRRVPDKADRRVVNILLTTHGKDILSQLSRLHQQEALHVQQFLSENLAPGAPQAR
jgi:DNA-binding MarR family transcriptional regulator